MCRVTSSVRFTVAWVRISPSAGARRESKRPRILAAMADVGALERIDLINLLNRVCRKTSLLLARIHEVLKIRHVGQVGPLGNRNRLKKRIVGIVAAVADRNADRRLRVPHDGLFQQ